MTTRGIGRKTAAFQFVYGTLHCSSLRGGVLLDQTQDPDCGQLVQEAGLRFFVWHLANHSSPIGGSVKLTMSLLNIIIPVSSVVTSSTLSTLRSSTWAVRMASQLDCSFNSQGGWFVCLFVCLLSALAIPTPASQRSFTCMCFSRVPQKVGVNVSPSIARYL